MAKQIKKTYSPTEKYPVGVASFSSGDIERTNKQQVNAETLLKAYSIIDLVRSCIDAISYAVSGSGYHFSPRFSSQVVDENDLALVQEFFENPNAEDTMDDLITEVSMDMLTFGDGYLEKSVIAKDILEFNDLIKNKKNIIQLLLNRELQFPYKLFKISARYMKIEYKNNRISAYKQYDSSGALVNTFTPDQIIHFRLPSPLDEIYGLSPTSTLDSTLSTTVKADSYNKAIFSSNGTPRLHMDLGNVSEKALIAFNSYCAQELKGKPHRNLVTRGGVTIKPLAISNSDMEFSQYLVSLREKSLSVFRVQPGILGVFKTGDADIDKQIALFKFLSVNPIKKIIASRINKKIMSDFFKYLNLKFFFNPVDSLDSDIESQSDERDLRNQVTVVNEVRSKRGLSAKQWGNVPIIPFSDAKQAVLDVNADLKPDVKNKNKKEI